MRHLLGASPAMVTLRAQIQQLVRFDTPGHPAVPTLLLQGETGTGKSLAARVVHDNGPRATRPFVEVNCAALPETMLEAELFGFEVGAFTDARRAKPGLFEAAVGGTLFLDEIDAIPLTLQSKLLTALENKRVRRLGAVDNRQLDVKLIAATNMDLAQAIATGRFRADLYHRLAVIILELPPLRQRGADVVLLAQTLLTHLAEAHGLVPKHLTHEAETWLQTYPWPGNVRELRHVLERVTLLHPHERVEAATLAQWCQPSVPSAAEILEAPPAPTASSAPPLTTALALPAEAVQLQEMLIRTGGNLAQTARLLGISRDVVRSRMRRYHLSRPALAGATYTPPGETDVRPAQAASHVSLSSDQEDAEAMSVPEAVLPALRSESSGERRQVTVLLGNLASSTTLASQLDPEDWQTVLEGYHNICTEVVARYEGYMAQYLGDGVLVYFGYPQVQEDDALRAVQAGLALVEACQSLVAAVGRAPVQVRVGLHTGLVVVSPTGTGTQRAPLALGNVPAVASRLQQLATPGTVLLSDATARLVAGYIALQDCGCHHLKGLTAPMQVSQAVALQGIPNRLEAARTRGLTPFVGRAPEVALLRERWQQVQDGHGQAVLLSGEAGIGKSRLVREVQEQVVSDAALPVVCQGVATQQHSPLAPLITALCRWPGLEPERPVAARLYALEQALAPLAWPCQETVPLLATLLALPLPPDYAPLSFTPQQQKQRTLETLLHWLLFTAEQHPVLLIVEDLHWVDPSTLEWLTLVLEHVPTMALYVLLTCRPEWRVPWPPRAHLTSLTLPRLPEPQVAEVVQAVAGTKRLPDTVVQQVVQQTDGVPLFIEELTKAVLESGLLYEHEDRYTLSAPLPALAIPPTLHASLLARLDRLGSAKRLAQLGATLGRQFAYTLLRAVVPDDEATLQRDLRRLIEAELLYQRGLPPQATYRFKHALIQETAYQTLLKRTRQQYHGQIAEVLGTRFPEVVATQPELLAQHYTEAGLALPAVESWQRAGQRALERAAYTEALAHSTSGLDLLQTLPENPARQQQELALLLTLGPALLATKGYTAPEVVTVHDRAHALCQMVPESLQLAQPLRGLWYFHSSGANHRIAQEISKQLLALGQRHNDTALLMEAHRMLGLTTLWRGDPAPALVHAERSIPLADRLQQHALPFHALVDPGVSCRYLAAMALQALGYPAQALQRSQEAVALAEACQSPFTRSNLLTLLAPFHLWRREGRMAQKRAETALAFATVQGFVQMVELATICRGAALVYQNHAEESLGLMRPALDAFQTMGARNFTPWGLAMLAEAYAHLQQPAAGLQALTEAQALVAATDERFYAAEIARLHGELHLHAGRQVSAGKLDAAVVTAAEAYFQEALEIARRQQAHWWELRAARSLARFWLQQGRRREARQLLAEVYGWFTEGFDLADLQEARAFLTTLA